jgi:ribulose kinase
MHSRSSPPHNIDAVIVAFDRTLDYRKLNTAYQALIKGAKFFATNADKMCPMPGGGIPDDWWESLVVAVRACLEQANIPLSEIKGICADATTCTLLPIKLNGQPLRRALLWIDVRATEQATRIFETGHEALRYSLAGVSAEWMPAKTLWLKECEPEIYAASDYLIEYTDWLAYKLTGRIAHNLNTVSQRWYYHKPSGGWQHDFFETIGLGGVEEKSPKDVLAIGENVGTLSGVAASELGLPAGIPIAMGGGDAFIGILGLGVTEPGDLALVTGSSNVISALSKNDVHCPGIFGSFPCLACSCSRVDKSLQVPFSTGSNETLPVT